MLLIYVALGGAHADIMTDGVQGAVMVVLAAGVIVMFLTGYGVIGGLPGLVEELRAQDPDLAGWLNPNDVRYHSWWAILAILLSHIPLGLLPHLGNKVWALRDARARYRFVGLGFSFGLLIGMLGLGGLLARGVLGADLENGNHSLPLLFIELFPAWFAALLGVGILAAVMSTADGLVVSSSQILANDFYRCGIVPRWRSHLDPGVVDAHVLTISRYSTVAVMLSCTVMAWLLMDVNVAMIIWIGVGGMMAAFAGPLVLGAVWKGVTRAGALSGLVVGVAVFGITHGGLIDPSWFGSSGALHGAALWLAGEAPSPWSCATMGELASLGVTFSVSKLTRALPAAHLAALFSSEPEPESLPSRAVSE